MPFYNVAASSTCNPLSFIFGPPSGKNHTFTITNSQSIPSCPICFTVDGCYIVNCSVDNACVKEILPVSGAVINLFGTGTTPYASGITDSVGKVVIDILTPGKTNYSVSQPNFITNTGMLDLSCGQNVLLELCAPIPFYIYGCNLGYTGAGAGLKLNIPGLGISVTPSPLGYPNGMGAGPFTIPQQYWGQGFDYTVDGNIRYAPVSGVFFPSCCTFKQIGLLPASGYICTPCFTDPIPKILHGTADGIGFTLTYPDWSSCIQKTAPTVSWANVCPEFGLTDPCTYSDGEIGARISMTLDGTVTDIGCNLSQTSITSTDCSCNLNDPSAPPYTCDAYLWLPYCPSELIYLCNGNPTYYQPLHGGFCYCVTAGFNVTTIDFVSGPGFVLAPVPVNLSISMPGQLFTTIDITE